MRKRLLLAVTLALAGAVPPAVLALCHTATTAAARHSVATTVSASAVPTASPSGPTHGRDAGPAAAPREADGDWAQREAALTAQLRAVDDGSPASFAVAMVNHRNGHTYVYGGREHFETASIVKVEILATLLLRAQSDHRALTGRERTLAERMIRHSDNSAATALWNEVDEAEGVGTAGRRLGLTETRPGGGGYWGLTTTTAEDQARLLDTVADPVGPLSPASRDYLFDLMRTVADDQDWGVSAAAADGETVALKNGWMPRTSQHGRWTINSIGRITDDDTDVTLVVLSNGHPTLSGGIAAAEKVARLTREYLDW